MKGFDDISESIDFFTSERQSEIIQISEFQISPFHMLFGILNMKKTGSIATIMQKQKVPKYTCVFSLGGSGIWAWFGNDDLKTCKRVYKETMNKYKDGKELLIYDIFGLEPSLKVSMKGIMIHGPPRGLEDEPGV